MNSLGERDSSNKNEKLFAQPYVYPNLFFSAEHILKNVGNQTVDGSHWLFSPHTFPFVIYILQNN